MIVITAQTVSDGLRQALLKLRVLGVERSSRNGPVSAFSCPVTTVYTDPRNRVLLSPTRDANPYFHFMEAIWMLGGREDVTWPAAFAKRIATFSDDGEKLWGAYGYRWRHFFNFDQLDSIIEILGDDPESRRAVLTMWNGFWPTDSNDPLPDLLKGQRGGKDVPCNTHIYFDLRGGVLNMTVCCRSNDIIWGCYGANAVHMSMLQEYIACALGVAVGSYSQMSNDLHLYTALFSEQKVDAMISDLNDSDPYWRSTPEGALWRLPEEPMFGPTIADYRNFSKDMQEFLTEPDGKYHAYRTMFFAHTAYPMWMSHFHYKACQHAEAMLWAQRINAWDWRRACTEWLERRFAAKRTKK